MVKPESRCSFVIFVKTALELCCIVTQCAIFTAEMKWKDIFFFKKRVKINYIHRLMTGFWDVGTLKNGGRSECELDQWAIGVDKTSNWRQKAGQICKSNHQKRHMTLTHWPAYTLKPISVWDLNCYLYPINRTKKIINVDVLIIMIIICME